MEVTRAIVKYIFHRDGLYGLRMLLREEGSGTDIIVWGFCYDLALLEAQVTRLLITLTPKLLCRKQVSITWVEKDNAACLNSWFS